MAITIVTRAGKGSNIDATENDANLNNLAAAIENVATGHDHDGVDSKKVVAANIVNTPMGDIAAITVQAALNELDTEKAPKANPAFTGNVGIGMTAPTARLFVQGDFSNNGTGGIILDAYAPIPDRYSLKINPYIVDVDNVGYNFHIVNRYTGEIDAISITGIGNVGIGKTGPNYKLEIQSDSAGKPGAGGLWTVVSDERIKIDIELADLNRCYEIIKSIPLKRFAWADGVYTEDQVKDRHNLGWIAQDVQKVFSKAVNVIPFTKAEKILDGQQEYEEQDFTLETVEKESTSIEIIDGKAVQVKKVVKEEVKTLLFNNFNVFDENGEQVFTDEAKTIPLIHQTPKMVKKTREKFRQEVIEDCLDLNSGQLYAAMYGAIQALMLKVEYLETKLTIQN